MGGIEPEMLCTDIYIFVLTKDEKINVSTGALYVLNEPMTHAVAVTQLHITFKTIAVNPTIWTFCNSLQLRLYVCQIQ
jgi:hypothetical protein